MTIELTEYNKFISMASIVGDSLGNKNAIDFVTSFLEGLGFNIRISNTKHTAQPTIIAHYSGRLCDKKIVIYGHYDVAPVKSENNWLSENPFLLKRINGRIYGRGIADNKGPLLARMLAMKSLILSKKAIPEIMWLIQGEEEIMHGNRVAYDIFKHEISSFGANTYIEETGFNNLDTGSQIAFLWSPSLTDLQLSSWHDLLNHSLDNPNIEYRHLNKLNGIKACPLLANLPKDSVYIGFGPNDRLHNIHQDNESLDESNLLKHQKQFENFLANYASYSHAV
ncbi:M20/M25/M40 family metallo-hydrolase [Pseudoalteromonas sp. S558]|jgi:acetylornithine deacetylase/succinyl-diaminopimelate desuccinylase-like protein|uniref:M20/M25/M40 family metallo-hydrolase n=1 Tax=Pseudoalteromonas sp. S558 TaxID=2066515 RepID=UPI00207BC05D|nr:M20/M25/M40 family metallo-hydrolase [Pseudoalteromonas sp. S558]